LSQYKSIAAIDKALTARISELKRQEAVLTEAVTLLGRAYSIQEAKLSLLSSMVPASAEIPKPESVGVDKQNITSAIQDTVKKVVGE
jgi:hypothetical protein